jgi:hypothetical protein
MVDAMIALAGIVATIALQLPIADESFFRPAGGRVVVRAGVVLRLVVERPVATTI